MSKIKTQHRRRRRPKLPDSDATSAQDTSAPAAEPQMHRLIRYLLWLYLLALIFDGAARKWLVPGLSDVILVSRIPIVAAIYALALPARLVAVNGYVIVSLGLALMTVPLALLAHGSIPVAIYGALVNYFFIPLIFIIPRVLDYRETERMGRFLLILTPPMTILIAMQFYSPQSAWVNLSVGGVESEGFMGALGRNRPPGTFSFISGVAQYYTLAFAFFLNQYISKRTLPTWLLLIIGPAFLMAIYGSISRLLALSVVLVFVFAVAGLVINGRKLHNTFRIGLALVVFFAIASRFTYFQDGVETFSARWEQSIGEDTTAQEVVVKRTFGDLIFALVNPQYDSIIGDGLGMGTNVGAKLLVGDRAFLGGEGEWGRIISELGPVLGYVYIFLRMAITLMLFLTAFRAVRRGNFLPWLIFSATLFLVLNGQWGQQTTLGFAILSAGFILSACNNPERELAPKQASAQS